MKILFLSDFLPTKDLKFDISFDHLINEADKVIFNLEGSPLMENEKDSAYQIMPFYVSVIIDFIKNYGKSKFVIALANNHILDNGEKAFQKLTERLDFENIEYLGTKNKPYIILNNELAILNFVTAETVAKKSSERTLNYLFYNKKRILSQINELEHKGLRLILYPHWGRDMDREIFNTYNFQKKFDNWFVFGHHPHLISGITKNNIYSLGNTFIPHPNYYKRFEGVRYGLAVLFDTAANDYTLKLTEVKSNDNFEENFVLYAKAFKSVPEEVNNYDKNFSKTRKLFLKLFAFKNTKWDLLKLHVLQGIAQLFHLKAVLKKGNYDK